jgi:nitroreductase
MEMSEEVAYRVICERRSVRNFDDRPVGRETLDRLLEAARWAPSGLNNQPWRFATVESPEMLDRLAGFTKYGKILRGAKAAVAVFLDTETVYSRDKDIQGVGAAVENLLLAAHALGLGACWLGEILNRRAEVEQALGVPPTLELMAVVALGHPVAGARQARRERLPLDKLIVGRF